MRSKIIKQIFIVLILSAIPSLLSYLANSSLIFDKLIEHGFIGKTIDIPLIQDYCLWMGIVFSAIALSLNLIITKVQYGYIEEQRNSLIKMSKYYLATSLGRRFLSDTSAFDIRIFIPKHPILYKIADKMNLRKVPRKFIIKNIDLIAEQGATKDLQFEVSPKREGLVGICFQTKSMVHDDSLENTNSTDYDLNQNQIAKTSDLKWSICCPICDNNNSVVAIVALDGKTKITIDEKKEKALKDELFVFTRLLFDSVPQLFKR